MTLSSLTVDEPYARVEVEQGGTTNLDQLVVTSDETAQAPVAGYKAQTVFFFGEERLSKVVVTFQESHDDPNQYIQDFFALRALLTKKYGKSVKEINRWRERDPIQKPSTAPASAPTTITARPSRPAAAPPARPPIPAAFK